MQYARTLLILLGSFALLSSPLQAGIVLKGANGKAITFAGILQAEPDGLVLATSEKAKHMKVAWNAFDLADLASSHPEIEKARTEAIANKQRVYLKLGIFKGAMTYDEVLDDLIKRLTKPTRISVPTQTRRFVGKYLKNATSSRVESFQDDYLKWLEMAYNKDNFKDWWAANRSFDHAKLDTDGLHILQSLGKARSQSYQTAIYYFRGHRSAIETIKKDLQAVKKHLPSKAFDLNQGKQSSLQDRIDYCLKGLDRLFGESSHQDLSAANHIRQFASILEDAIRERER